ncbi:unnamed protein product [Cyprideis torosa]|uniref:Uncharacterized protein n=1 Tax=Cyprideis torosa TaxID=163714 RepID=A0A7R8ZIF1_9CRUS|nr:unnamed protein product [Cyprideis torosa]CAG0885968.1 unnamed protein product [Cyprideis torosa]
MFFHVFFFLFLCSWRTTRAQQIQQQHDDSQHIPLDDRQPGDRVFTYLISTQSPLRNELDLPPDEQSLPPSWDDKNTISGAVEGIVKLDGQYEEGLGPTIFTNRTTARLNCSAGSMKVDLEFKEPFYGVVYADFDRYSACQVTGNGGLKYSIEVELRGCGTVQSRRRGSVRYEALCIAIKWKWEENF